MAVSTRQQLITYDLATACRLFQTPSPSLERFRQLYQLPAHIAGTPLLIDAGLKFPTSLATALQTLALYNNFNWNELLGRRLAAGEFFKAYLELFLTPTVKLALNHKLTPNLSLANLVVLLERGMPLGMQLREPTKLVVADQKAWTEQLLELNLRPLVTDLATLSGAKPEIFWDWAIEILLGLLHSATAEVQAAMLINELNPGKRLIIVGSCATATTPYQSQEFIYVKQRCCEKFKRDNRCSSCPGLVRR